MAKLDEQTLHRLVGEIYEAVLDDGAWEPLLGRMAQMMEAASGVLIVHDLRHDNEVNLMITNGFPLETLPAYAAYYARLEPYVETLARMPAGSVIPGRMSISPEDLRRTEFYNDWQRYTGLHDVLGGFVHRSGDSVVKFGFQRNTAMPFFEMADVEAFQPFMPHLSRAFAMRSRLQGIQTAQDATANALARLEWGVFLLGEDGRVVYANPLAEAQVRMPGGLRLRGGRLAAPTVEQTRRLEACIRDACRTGRGEGVGLSAGVAVAREGGLGPLLVSVSPLRARAERFGLAGQQVCAVVVTSEPERRRPVPEEALRRLYGLTPAEARLAQAMGQGESVNGAADRLGITRHTARTQLRAVYDKLGVHRQAELVRLLISLAAHGAALATSGSDSAVSRVGD